MDRFRSRIVESDADLIGLIRYVHTNPLEAGIVPSLDALASYPWTGHGALVGARPAHPFEAVGAALSLFDEDAGRARAELLAWMARDGDGSGHVPACNGPVGVASRGSDAGEAGLAGLLGAACEHYALAPEQLASGAKQPRIARARATVAYVAVVEMGAAGGVVAQALGVSRAAISGALERGRRAAAEDGFHFEVEPGPDPRGKS
jgi:hypothetical protein